MRSGKILIWIGVVMILIAWASATRKCSREIETRGLKAIAIEIWEGKEVTND